MNALQEKKWVCGYCDMVEDLWRHEKVQEMQKYPHHKVVNTLRHSVYVSFLTYRVCAALHWHVREATRAALLHDFYLYNWYLEKHDEYHVWYHPKTAVQNIERYFGTLTPMQRDMVLSHMWPLHLQPPKTREGFVLTFADKIGATQDLLGLSRRFSSTYALIETEMKRRGDFSDNC